MACIEMHPHPCLIFYLGQFNILKSILYVEKSVTSQQIILNKKAKDWKRSLVTVNPSIRPGQIMKESYNAWSQIMKVLRMMISM